ncbi:MAG: hypothetical protein P4M04_04560 [Acidobacteriota bacterium]|nr:hypothetical protein [Acidobacteriota bacterium]
MVLASIAAGRMDDLRHLLASMNREVGVVDPQNRLVPFGQFERLHFARFVIIDDKTSVDVAAYGLPIVQYPVYLAFLGDLDGSPDALLAELVQKAGDGLRRIFAHCDGFSSDTDILGWMKSHNVAAAAFYANWLGRTVRQVREEDTLRQALESFVEQHRDSLAGMQAREKHAALKKFVAAEQRAGRITLTPPEPTPLGWKIRNFLHLVGVPLVLLVLSPLLLLYLPVFIYQLRSREKTDPVIAPRIEPSHAHELAELEDHETTNQFSAFGSLKPELFRRELLTFLLWIIDYAARHVFNRGRLTRVTTIHFARWVFVDNKRRMLFASNYDGSLESYMDDFINKVGFGLNIAFSNGLGYPQTNWLFMDGAKDEQKFKYMLRRHQLPTQVWYHATPGLTAMNMQRNALIRQGLENMYMTDGEVREWLQLL